MQENELKKRFLAHSGKTTDKWSLYLDVYHRLLSDRRDSVRNLLEIGVQNGGSLEVWADYFPNVVNLVGCDVDPRCRALSYSDPRISLLFGDANSQGILERVQQISGTYELIIDDGSHKSSDIINSFLLYFPLLVDGGLFIIEDLHCSYWREFEGGLAYEYSSMAFLKGLVDVVNHEHWGLDMPREATVSGIADHYGLQIPPGLLEQVHAIEFLNSTAIVRKLPAEKNTLGARLVRGEEAAVEPAVLDMDADLPEALPQKPLQSASAGKSEPDQDTSSQ